MHTTGRRRRGRSAGLVTAVASVLVALVAAAAPAVGSPGDDPYDPPPIKIEIDSPAPGLPDLLDPPLIAPPNPGLLQLEVPRRGPWMLFDRAELAELRTRILGAPPGSAVHDAWSRLLDLIDDDAFRSRDGVLGAIDDLPDRRWGRDDLLLVAFVWHITEDDEHLDLARRLLGYAVGLSPDHGAPLEPGVDEFYIQRAHRLNGFALAYDLLRDVLPPIERLQLRLIVESLARQHLVHATTSWWGTVSAGSNIGGNNAAALGTAAMALWHEAPDAPLWAVRAEQLVRAYFHEGFDPGGASIEGVLYGNYGMRIPTYFGEALRRAGHRGFFAVGGIPGHQASYAHEVLPGGGAVNPMNDARYFEINPTFTTWSIAHGDQPELSAWLFDEMTRKVPGGERSVGELLATLLWYEPSDPAFDPADHLRLAEVWPELGLVHTRSGWRDGDLYASLLVRGSDWGEGVHQNHDVGQFTLYAHGANLVTDSRYANWLSKVAALDLEAARTSESEAHNLVVADSRSQDFFGKGDLVGFATTASIGHPGRVDIAAADARLAWLVDQPQRADRYFLHVRAADGAPAYLVVADRFAQGRASHRYTSFLHTDWRNEAHVDPDDAGRVRIESGQVPGVGLDVDIHAGTPITTAIGSFTPDDAQDWARIGEPGRKAHDRVETTTTAPAYEAVAVLAPTAPGEPGPLVRRVRGEGGLASVVEAAPGVTDVVLLATGSSEVVAAEGVRTDAAFATVRRGPGGVAHVAFTGGTYVEVDGERVADLGARSTTAAVDLTDHRAATGTGSGGVPAGTGAPRAAGGGAGEPAAAAAARAAGRLPRTGGPGLPVPVVVALAAGALAVHRRLAGVRSGP